MKPAAYLVDLAPTMLPKQSVFLDCAKAVEYAAKHHGGVLPLVPQRDHDRLRITLDYIHNLKTHEGETKAEYIARVKAIIEA